MRKTSVDDGYPHLSTPVNVCDVEKIYRWFNEAEHYVRINFVVTLLENSCGFEYRFIAACLENMCQKAYKSLVDEEKKANCKEEIEKLPDNDTRTRYNLIIFLSLLRSTNEKCAVAIYNKICSSEACRRAGNYDVSIENDSLYNKELGQKLLLYTLGSKHPAFSFHHRRKLCDTARNLVRQKEGASKIAVAAAHCTQPAASSTYIREQYNQPETHTHPIRAACAKNALSPAKGAVNPTFTLQVTWSDHHISHAKHTSEDFSHLHDKVMQMVEQNSAAQESLQKLRNNGFATSDTVDNYLKCLFSSSVPQAIHQSETLFKFFKPRVKSRSTIDGETDTTLSTTSTNRERDPFIKSKTVDSSPRNNSGNARDQNLSKEAPAVIRTSPRKPSGNTNQSLAVTGVESRIPQMHDSGDCLGNSTCSAQAVREDGVVNAMTAVKDESSAALEISDGQKLMQSRKPTIQFGEHTANIRQFSAVLKQSASHVEREQSKVEALSDLQPTVQIPPEMPANIAFNIQNSGSTTQLDLNAVQRGDSAQISGGHVLPVQQQQQQHAHHSGEEFCRIAAVDTNEISNVPVPTLLVSPNKARSNSGPQQIPQPPLPPGQMQQLSSANNGAQLVQNGNNTSSPANPMLNDNIIMLTPHGLATVQAAGMGNAAGVIHVPIHPCFYQAPHPPQHIAQNPNNQSAQTMPVHNQTANPAQSAPNVTNAANVNNLSESKTNVSNPTSVKVPLASDIVKGVASAPKLSPTNNVPGPSGGAQTNPDQLPSSSGNQIPQREAAGAVDNVGNAMKHHIPPQPTQAWLLDQHLHDPASRQTALSNLAALNKLAPVENQPGTGLGPTLMPFKYGAVAATGAANLNIADRAFISQHPTAAAAAATINPQVWQLLHHAQGNQLPIPNRQPYNNLAVTSNLVPGQIVMTPTYHKHLLPANHFITHVPGMAMEPTTGQPLEIPGGLGSNLVLSPTAPKEVFCSNCGRAGHCFHDCAEPSMNTILNSEGFRIQTEGDAKPEDSGSSPSRQQDVEMPNTAGSNSVNQLNVNSDHSIHLQAQQQNLKEPRSSSSTCSNNEYSGNRSYQSNKNSQHHQQSASHSHISKQSHNQQQHSRGSNSGNTPAKQHNPNQQHQQENQRQNLMVPKQILQRGSGGPGNNKEISPRKQNNYNSKSIENITSSSSQGGAPPHISLKGQQKQQSQHTQNQNAGTHASGGGGGGGTGTNKSGNSKTSSASSSSVVPTSVQQKSNASISPVATSAGAPTSGVTSSGESR